MANEKSEAQAPFTNPDNYSLDIEKAFKEYISKIDTMKSFTNILGSQKYKNLKNKKYEDFKQINDEPNKIEAQESRLNVFYRLLGLPVFSKRDVGKFFNPGISPDQQTDDYYEKVYNLVSSTEELFPIFNERERINSLYNNYLKNGGPDSVFLTLLASKHVRKFNFFKDSDDAFDLDPKKQTYESDANKAAGQPGAYTESKDLVNAYYNSYDSSSNIQYVTDNEATSKTRYHFIKPMMPDPRSLLSIHPDSRVFAAPFAKYPTIIRSSQNSAGTDVIAPTCILEQICKSRFTNSTSKLSDADKARIKEITDALKDTSLNYFNSNGSVIETEALIKNYDIIKAMIKELADAYANIIKLTSEYTILFEVKGPLELEYYKSIDPIFDRSGMSGTNKIFPKSGTTKDNTLVGYKFASEFTNIVNRYFKDIKQNITKLPGADMSETVANNEDSINYESLAKEREQAVLNVKKNIQTIEIIIGNYTGLGLADIIAHVTALWSIDKETLASLLDDYAINRIMTDDNWKSVRDAAVSSRFNSPGTVDGKVVLKKYEDAVILQYKIMDSLFNAAYLNALT